LGPPVVSLLLAKKSREAMAGIFREINAEFTALVVVSKELIKGLLTPGYSASQYTQVNSQNYL